MISPVSSLNTYTYYNIYRSFRPQGQAGGQVQEAPAAKTSSASLGIHRAADPETPVQPVVPALAVNSDASRAQVTDMTAWGRSYLAEQAVRMRIQYVSAGQSAPVSGTSSGVDSIRKANEEGTCETCEKRKYQDGSDDPSVSYQTPTRIDPDTAASAVRGHEMEHVAHEQSKALQEDRKVVSQSVTLHTDICPECGRVFVSGGTTRTVTKGDSEPENLSPEDGRETKAAA